MAQVLVKGTAWERSLEYYAYTRALCPAGWAWEFLRRNGAYQRDVRLNRAGLPLRSAMCLVALYTGCGAGSVQLNSGA